MSVLNQNIHENWFSMMKMAGHTNISDSFLLWKQIKKILSHVVCFDWFFKIIWFLVFSWDQRNFQSLSVFLFHLYLCSWVHLLVRYIEFLVFMEDDLMLIGHIENLLNSLRYFFFILFSSLRIRVAHDFRTDVVSELIVHVVLIHLCSIINCKDSQSDNFKSDINVEIFIYFSVFIWWFSWFTVEEITHYLISSLDWVFWIWGHEV